MIPSSDPSNLVPSLIGLAIVASLTAYYASRKGRNPFLWFIWGCLLGVIAPLILFVLTFLKEKEPADSAPERTNPSLETSATPSAEIPPAAPVEPENQERLWYYLNEDHNQIGPVSLVAMKDLWNTGRLNIDSFVWSKGMPSWQKINETEDLKAMLDKR